MDADRLTVHTDSDVDELMDCLGEALHRAGVDVEVCSRASFVAAEVVLSHARDWLHQAGAPAHLIVELGPLK